MTSEKELLEDKRGITMGEAMPVIEIPVIWMEPKCPVHPNAKNVKIGVAGSIEVEFYCKHCKKTYVFIATARKEVDGTIVAYSKVKEKKNKKKYRNIINDNLCKIYRLEVEKSQNVSV